MIIVDGIFLVKDGKLTVLFILFPAQNLQQLLKNVSQAKKVHDSRSARNKRENFFDDRIACSQRSKSAANWQSRKSDLVSLLQCTAPGSIGCTVQRQQYNWSASNMSQQIQQTAPQSSSVQHRFSVKSIGESLNITYQGSTHLESVPFSPSSHSNVSFFNAPMIRGLSPQWKSNKLNHLIDAKQEGNCIDRNCLQQNASKSSANDVDSKFSTMLSCAQARVLPVKRNLEAELNVDQTDGSTSKRKVRMGWSPHKRQFLFLFTFVIILLSLFNSSKVEHNKFNNFFTFSIAKAIK